MTGLDACSAYQVVQTLKSLARKGRTIIISIHSPRSEIWSLFDRIILLSKGFTLYSGPSEAAVHHFERNGFPCAPFVNPAEFLIDLAAADNRSEEAKRASQAQILHLSKTWQRESKPPEGLTETLPFPLREPQAKTRRQNVSIRRQTYLLAARTTKVTTRDPMGVAGSLFEVVLLSVVVGLIFLRLGTDLAGIRSREGALYTAPAFQGYLILIFESYRLTIDIKIFDRERAESAVGVPALLLSRRIARAPLDDLVVPTIFAIVFYFIAGFRADSPTFLVFWLVSIIAQYIAVNLASVCVAISRDFAVASLIANLCCTLQTFSCGYFVQADQIPIYVRWLKWLVSLGTLDSNPQTTLHDPVSPIDLQFLHLRCLGRQRVHWGRR